ncbi:MAG: hypothetical protein ABI624_00875 [Casimicrobiaceae bacterium]
MNRRVVPLLTLICAVASLGASAILHAQGWPPDLIPSGETLSVTCPTSSNAIPMFRGENSGQSYLISDPKLQALAAKACGPSANLGTTAGNVNIVNQQPFAIYVSFTLSSRTPGPISWGSGCTVTGVGAQILSGQTCVATVATGLGSTRFCAATDAPPADCYNAQVNHQTMVETIFESAANPGCFNKGNCVWYDISVIPSFCTDALWAQNQCAGTGGASYNLPVALSCGGTPTFACMGPTNNTYGSENYPSNCGNPAAQCVGSSATCVNAYFYPMYYAPENKYGPNVPCLSGQTFGIVFLAGS